jgi:hypothetical protein
MEFEENNEKRLQSGAPAYKKITFAYFNPDRDENGHQGNGHFLNNFCLRLWVQSLKRHIPSLEDIEPSEKAMGLVGPANKKARRIVYPMENNRQRL